MAAIHDLLAQIQDEELRSRIEKEVDKLAKTKKFGLVFEEHLPECTPLYDIPIKRGSTVAKKTGPVNDMFKVIAIQNENAICCNNTTNENEEIKLSDLVSVAQFGEPIYPYLKPIESVCNAPDNSLWHTLIEADNYHALQLLEYLYAGKVDCIYIDPPYNTGAHDWKYNNDYVDSSDTYRHSKWLSFMERRLLLAKKLLNPDTGVLIVTIDEHEVHRLRMILDEVFSDFYIQMVTYVTSPSGASQGRFSRIEEYAIYCFAKNAFVAAGDDPMIGEIENSTSVRWKSLLRSGPNSSRADRKNMFYPIYINKNLGTIVDVGEPLPFEEEPDFSPKDGNWVIWPVRTDGSLGRWGVGAETFKELVNKGYVQVGKYDEKRKTCGITYISSQIQKMIETGEVIITGRDENTGVVNVEYASAHAQAIRTVWYRTRHNAGSYGTNLISSILGKDRKFPFPKSVYATMDSIYSVVKTNRNALVVDFFAGSGTTQHAVFLMNHLDHGHRRCISITNNEVSENDAKSLSTSGIMPGTTEWDKYGIARYITWPRIKSCSLGKDINGESLKGNYLVDDLPMSVGFKENISFFKLGFLDKTAVALGRQLQELLPLLWLKSGSFGECPVITESNKSMHIFSSNHFAILTDEKYFQDFIEEVNKHSDIQTIYIVTDSESGYREMISAFDGKDTYQLYRDYLDNFRINVRRI